jgi:Phage integrase, N-terminal SAM-like domain
VTKLLQCLRDELVRRDYAAPTIRSYIQIVEAFRRHTGGRLDRITPAQLRRYHVFLLKERRLAIGTVVTQICALRFFCRYVLKRREYARTCHIRKSGTAYRSYSAPPRRSPAPDCQCEDLYHRTLLLTSMALACAVVKRAS